MPASSPQDQELGAEKLLARWLDRRGTADELDLEGLCRQHPERADELRALHAGWSRIAAIVGRGSSGAAREAAGGSASTPTEAGSVAWLLARLAERAEPSDRLHDEAEIARSAMARVVRVWDAELERPLAKKVVLAAATPPGDGGATPLQARSLVRFVREARTTARLDHPGIVPVHDVGLDDEGHAFFTMKLVEGRTLKEVFDELARGEGGWTQTRVLGLLLKVCEAMSYAHAKGVIHRDLKPANVMVGRFGEVYVMDWGLAKVLGRADEKDLRIREGRARATEVRGPDGGAPVGETPESPLLTMDGDVVGTPAYMPPEQAEGQVAEMGPQSDVYALGAMLYHLLAGRMPYVRSGEQVDSHGVWRRVKEGPPPALASEAIGAPAELVAICERAMVRLPAERYPDMAALAEDLRAYLEHRVVAAHRTGVAAELRKWVERNKVLATTVAVAAAVLLSSTVLYVAGVTSAQAATSAALVRTRALGLASASDEVLEVDGMLALLLAREAVNVQRTPETLSRLHHAVGAVRELAALRGTDPFTVATFSPRGDSILAGTLGKAILWDPESDRRIVLEHPQWLSSACFSPSGDLLLTASRNGTARLWNPEGDLLARFSHDGGIWACSFSPDGRHVLTASQDRTARLWDLQGNELLVLLGHDGPVLCATFSPDGRHVLTGSTDRTARLWRVSPLEGAAECLAELVGHEGAISSAAFSPAGDRIVTGSGQGVWSRGWRYDSTARLWDLEGTPLAVLEGHRGGVESVAFSPDGALVLTASSDRSGRLWSSDGRLLEELPTGGMAWAGAFSPDGARVALACSGRACALYDVSGKTLGLLSGHGETTMGIRFSPDSRRVVTASMDGSVRIWRAVDEEVATLVGHAGQVDRAEYAPDGSTIATASRDGTARLWSPTGELLAVLRGHEGNVMTVEYSPDGTRLVTASDDNTARLWDLEGRELSVLRHEESARQLLCATFSPRGDQIATGDAAGTVWVWDVAREESRRFPVHEAYGQAVNHLEYTSDGRHLLVASRYRPTTLLSLLDGSTRDIGPPARQATLAPDGDRVLVSCPDGKVVVVSLSGAAPVLELSGHGGSVTWASFSPSGEWIVTACVDRAARLWRADWVLEATLRGHSGPVYSAVFSPSEDRILTASADGTARTWVVDPDELVRLAERRSTRGFELDELATYADFLDLPAALEAHDLVRRLQGELTLKQDVLAHLREEPGLDRGLRRTALRMAEALVDSATDANDKAWELAQVPGRTQAEYARALRLAEAACELEPHAPALLNTLGAARYRAGLYQQALEALERADELSTRGACDPADDRIFIALALARLGEHEQAAARLAECEQLLEGSADPLSLAFLREARALIGGD